MDDTVPEEERYHKYFQENFEEYDQQLQQESDGVSQKLEFL